MKEKQRRTNVERAEATKATLLKAARSLFIQKGYAETSTPEIVARAQVTRGALYHHFDDKRELFRAVLEQEAEAVAAEIRAASPSTMSPKEALLAGSVAYLDAISVPGRTRLLLIDGPAVLGFDEIAALDAAHSAETLREGLEAVMSESDSRRSISVPALATLLSAAFDRAALAIESGSDPDEFRSAILKLVERAIAAPAPD
jgi:AcrR family transcriptional regulator